MIDDEGVLCSFCEADENRESTVIPKTWTFQAHDGFVIWLDEHQKIAHRHNLDYNSPSRAYRRTSKKSTRVDDTDLGDALIAIVDDPNDTALQDKAYKILLRTVAASISAGKATVRDYETVEALLQKVFARAAKSGDLRPTFEVNIVDSIAN